MTKSRTRLFIFEVPPSTDSEIVLKKKITLLFSVISLIQQNSDFRGKLLLGDDILSYCWGVRLALLLMKPNKDISGNSMIGNSSHPYNGQITPNSLTLHCTSSPSYEVCPNIRVVPTPGGPWGPLLANFPNFKC